MDGNFVHISYNTSVRVPTVFSCQARLLFVIIRASNLNLRGSHTNGGVSDMYDGVELPHLDE